MPRFITLFVITISLYWLLARPLILGVIVALNEQPIIEDAQRDVATVLVLLDALEQHLTTDELNALMAKNNEISNIPMRKLAASTPSHLTSNVAPESPLLKRIQIFNFENYHWSFMTKQGNVYHFGPALTINTLDRLVFILWFFFYLGFTMICLIWAWQWRRRVKHLNTVANDVAAGNLSIRANEHPHWRLGNINITVNHMLRKIEALVSSQRFLTNSVAHELRTPLSRMRFLVASLPEQQNTHIKAMNEELDELDNLINDVLKYARTNNTLAKQPVMLKRVADVLRSEIQRHSIQCAKPLGDTIDDSIMVTAGAGQLEQIISNILSNTIKYGKPPIHISLKKISQYTARIIIEDHGSGIPDAIIDRVFEPFFRGSQSGHGHGFGLAIVQQHAIQLGGQVSAQNGAAGGAKFTIDLPLS